MKIVTLFLLVSSTCAILEQDTDEDGNIIWEQADYRNRNEVPMPPGMEEKWEKKHKRSLDDIINRKRSAEDTVFDVEDGAPSYNSPTKKSFIKGSHFSLPIGNILPLSYSERTATKGKKSKVARVSLDEKLTDTESDRFTKLALDEKAKVRSEVPRTWGFTWKDPNEFNPAVERQEKATGRSHLDGASFQITEEDFDAGLMGRGLGGMRERAQNENLMEQKFDEKEDNENESESSARRFFGGQKKFEVPRLKRAKRIIIIMPHTHHYNRPRLTRPYYVPRPYYGRPDGSTSWAKTSAGGGSSSSSKSSSSSSSSSRTSSSTNSSSGLLPNTINPEPSAGFVDQNNAAFEVSQGSPLRLANPSNNTTVQSFDPSAGVIGQPQVPEIQLNSVVGAINQSPAAIGNVQSNSPIGATNQSPAIMENVQSEPSSSAAIGQVNTPNVQSETNQATATQDGLITLNNTINSDIISNQSNVVNVVSQNPVPVSNQSNALLINSGQRYAPQYRILEPKIPGSGINDTDLPDNIGYPNRLDPWRLPVSQINRTRGFMNQTVPNNQRIGEPLPTQVNMYPPNQQQPNGLVTTYKDLNLLRVVKDIPAIAGNQSMTPLLNSVSNQSTTPLLNSVGNQSTTPLLDSIDQQTALQGNGVPLNGNATAALQNDTDSRQMHPPAGSVGSTKYRPNDNYKGNLQPHENSDYEYVPEYGGNGMDGEFDQKYQFQMDGLATQYGNHNNHHNVPQQHQHAPYVMHDPHDDYASVHPGTPFEEKARNVSGPPRPLELRLPNNLPNTLSKTTTTPTPNKKSHVLKTPGVKKSVVFVKEKSPTVAGFSKGSGISRSEIMHSPLNLRHPIKEALKMFLSSGGKNGRQKEEDLSPAEIII